MNAIKIDQEETDSAPPQCSHIVGDGWMPHGANEIYPWTYTQYFMHSNDYWSWNLSSKYLPYPHQQFGETRSMCSVDCTHAQWWPKGHTCSCHHPSAALEKLRQCIPRSHFNGWWVSHGCIHLTLSQNDRILSGMPKCHWGRKLHGTVWVLWKSCTSCSLAKIDFCLTILC